MFDSMYRSPPEEEEERFVGFVIVCESVNTNILVPRYVVVAFSMQIMLRTSRRLRSKTTPTAAAMAALGPGLIQGPLGSPGGGSRQPKLEFWAV